MSDTFMGISFEHTAGFTAVPQPPNAKGIIRGDGPCRFEVDQVAPTLFGGDMASAAGVICG